MKAYYLRLLAVSALAPFAACAEGDHGPSGPQVAIDVAPLSLPGTLGVSYAVAVFNADPSDYTHIFDVNGGVQAANSGILVWQQPNLTSNQFGNGTGGDISYVGPCDASVDDNWVALALNRVDVGNTNGSYAVASGGAFSGGSDNLLDDQNSAFTATPGSNDLDPDFVNPAPYNDALVLKFPCEENEDTRVTFNLTVMRDAQQGFFDVAVNFEDIFCSMKVDTCYDGDEPITLLFGDEDGEGRVETAVIASACTAGTDDADTIMWMAPLTVSCDGGVEFTLDPTGGADGTNPGAQGNSENCAEATGVTAGTQATGTASFLTTALQGQTIPEGTECAPVVIIGGTPTYGPHFILDVAADPSNNDEGRVTVNVTAVDEGAAQAGTFNGYVHCFHTDPRTAYAETHLTATGGSDPSTGDTYELCYALYWGEEDLECDTDTSCNKEWWNVAINIDDLRDQDLTNCTVKTAITASSSTDVSPPTFINGTLPGPGQTYGYVAFDAELTDDNGAPTCFQGPMGSDYAAVKYGATKDMLGGEPFPQLCSSFAQGDDSPVPLKGITNYYFDERATTADARYIGSIVAEDNAAGQIVSYKGVRAEFSEMGTPIGGECGSTVKNEKEFVYFDVKWNADPAPREALFWRGIGDAALPLVGNYTVQAYGWNVDTWVAIGAGTTHDFATGERDGKKSNLITFAEGAAVSIPYDRIAIGLTRNDLGPVEDIKIVFGFIGGFSMEDTDTPPFIFALCSYETLECTCHGTSGDPDTCEPDADTDTYWF